MTKKDWINIWLILQDAYKKDKMRIICMIVMAFMEVIQVYIDIFLFGKIVDCFYLGLGVSSIVLYVMAVFLIKYLCVIIGKEAQKYYDTKLDYTKDIETKYMNQKSMGFDYELLEESSVSDLRYRSFGKSYYGITGWCLVNMKGLIKGFFSIVITIGLVGPALLSKASRMIQLGPINPAILMFLVVVVLTLLNYKAGIYYTNKAKEEINKAENNYNRKQYYFEKFSDIEFQKDIRISKLQDVIIHDVEAMYKELALVEYKHGNLYIKRERLGGILMGLNCVIVYLFTGLCAIAGVMTAGTVIIVASSILQFSNQMLTFASSLGNMKSAALFAQDYLDFMKLGDGKLDGNEIPGNNISEVEFKNVSFKYPGEEKFALKAINLKFKANEKIAIVGENGSGKTTLIKLLCGFYNDYEGEILVDGRNIKDLSKKDYWKKLSIVFQDFNILSFSIRDIFNTNDSDEEITKALKKAGLEVSSLDDKVGKTIYLEGINFSGGEKQKMAIARSIFKKADLIIMDEPTAALDPIAENEVYAGFDNLIEGHGGVFISHRLSSCKYCERIVVMKNGEIVQQGKHEHLVNEDGDYQLLWSAQKECYE